jgi:ankyrin repeat protein
MDFLHKLLSNYLTRDTRNVIGNMLNDGDLDVVNRVFDDEFKLTHLREHCLVNNYLNLFHYIFGKDDSFSERDFRIVAESGNLNMFEYLCYNTDLMTPITPHIIYSAIKYDHIHILEYIDEHMVCIDEHMVCIDEYALTVAIRYGSIKCVKYLHQNGYNFDEHSITEAIKQNNLQIVKFLHQNCCIINDEDIELAKEINIPEIVEYLESHTN